MKLLTTKNLKVEKGNKFGYFTAILHLAPFNLSGKNVCPNASNGCAESCLNTSGHGRYQRTQNARIRRTLQFFNDREQFFNDLRDDIKTVVRRAKKNGVIPCIRLNGTSDIPTLALKMAGEFPDVQFYDYTKNVKTFSMELPKNYHLTFSRSETNESKAIQVLKNGFNVAVVFEKMPETWQGYKVVNGEESDLRFLDETNVVVGLTAKGRAKHDKSGFVIRATSEEGN